MINLDVRAQFWEVFHFTLQGNESFSFLVVCNKTEVFHFAWNAMQEFLKKFSLLHTLYAMVFFAFERDFARFFPLNRKIKTTVIYKAATCAHSPSENDLQCIFRNDKRMKNVEFSFFCCSL